MADPEQGWATPAVIAAGAMLARRHSPWASRLGSEIGAYKVAELLTRCLLPLEEALAIAAQIAGALEAAHEQGLDYCDLTPPTSTCATTA